MLVPVSWLRDLVSLPASVTPREIAEAITRRGLEVEGVIEKGSDLTGPLKVGRVLSVEELTEFKKPIRWVSLDLGESEPRWVVCGATNFTTNDLVVVAIPGAVLPGGFAISARETYGKTSNGMICSSRELGLSEDHSGIIVLPPNSAAPGDDAIELLQIQESVIDVAVTPDRGYALSMRGIAREVAIAFDSEFSDPALAVEPLALEASAGLPAKARSASIDAPVADRIVLRTVDGFDPEKPTPLWMRRRLEETGMRSISLLVDITNYVMLELGQPLHAFDDLKLDGSIHVRHARAGEKLETLDHVVRTLDPADGVIADDQRALALAGVMGGLESEIDERSSRTTIEAAHFNSTAIAKTSRRHRLSSEASRRFERGVDSELPPIASARAVQLLMDIAGGTYVGGCEIDQRSTAASIAFDFELPSRLIGHTYSEETVRHRLTQIGCSINGTTVTPPSWRPDLTLAEDLVEEVARLEGYDHIPSVLPTASGGYGLSQRQRLRRRTGMVLAARGGVEVLTYPFVGETFFEQTGSSSENAVRLANPLSEEEPFLRTSLLGGLVSTAQRNISRGTRAFSIFEIGSVFIKDGESVAPRLGVSARPTDRELDQLLAAIPHQPLHVAGLACGDVTHWWGETTDVDWTDAVSAAEAVLVGRSNERRTANQMPWHPGRCAEIVVGGVSVGFAGELHPRLIGAWGLPSHTAYFELNLDALEPQRVSASPLATVVPAIEDLALVVSDQTPAENLRQCILNAHPLVEQVTLFDRYQLDGERVSLAFTILMRAPDRTLTAEEIVAVREAVLTSASELGASLR